jgi:uncharacterized phage protein gp47/JayE
MPRFQIKRFEQILSQMIARIVSRTELSDVSDSSVTKHILAAAARQDDELYYQMSLLLKLFSIDTATGEDLDERAKDIQPGTVTRLEAQKASGNVVFSRNGTTGTVVITAGTKVKTADGLVFTTTASGTITPTSPEQIGGHGVGRDSGLVPVIADEPGEDSNVVSNTVIKFVQKPTGVDEVTNPSGFANGTDQETDDAFRNRIKQFINSLARSTIDSLESGVLGAQDENTGATILYSIAIEDSTQPGYVTVYIDDGTGSAESSQVVASENVTAGLAGPPADSAVGGEESLFLENKPVKSSDAFTLVSSTRGTLTGGNTYISGNDYWYNHASGQINFDPALTTGEVITASYTYYTGLIQLAQKIIDGDATDRTNYPGLRAAGILVTVLTPQVLAQNIEVTLVILEGYDQNDVKINVKEAIKTYVNSLGISGDLLVSEMIKRIMNVSGVYNVLVTTPSSDVILLDDQLARTTDSNVTVN